MAWCGGNVNECFDIEVSHNTQNIEHRLYFTCSE